MYLPSVEDPAATIQDEFGREMIEVNLLTSGNFSHPIDFRSGKYFFVNLEDYTKDETNSVHLTRHDQMITSFYKEFLLQNSGKILIVFTGKEARHKDKKREVQQEDSPYVFAETDVPNSTNSNSTNKTDHSVGNGFIWKTEYVLFYYTSISLTDPDRMKKTQPVNVTVTDVTATLEIDGKVVNSTINGTNTNANTNTNGTTSDPNTYRDGADETNTNGGADRNDTSTNGTNTNGTDATTTEPGPGPRIIVNVSVSYHMTSNVTYDDNFQFIITIKYGYWSVKLFTWNDEVLLSDRLISAADKFSFHCTPAIRLSNPNRSNFVTLEGLQLQPKFGSGEGQLMESFNDAYDCVGFVSHVILCGMLVTFMLLFILSIGISCIMDIKPIDRFDNPKGKTITVTGDG